jgi:hypothetical protein
MREFLLAVASGFTVAVLSAIFLRRPLPKSGPSQNMTMGGSRNSRWVWLPLIFLLAFAVALGVLFLLHGQPSFVQVAAKISAG